MSKKVLILAEARGAELKKSSLELVGAAKGMDTLAVIFGSQAKKAAEDLAKYVKEVLWVKDAQYDHYHPEAYASALSQLIDEFKPEIVLGNSSSLGKDLLPALAAHYDSTIVADCTFLDLSQMKFQRPFYSGKAIGEITLEPLPMVVVSLRPNSLGLPSGESGSGQVKELSPSFDFAGSAIKFIERTQAKSDRPDLTEANVIVSGGRSLKLRENFKLIFECADAFGGAAGASRAAVDEGLADHDMQVGQTGKTVNPSLYVACGISGAIQHLAGMRTSKVIVAINKDPNAPIFSKADYGIVGDLFEVVPALTAEVRKLLGKAA